MNRHTQIRQVVLARLREQCGDSATFFDGLPAFVDAQELPAVAVWLSDAQYTGKMTDEDDWQAVLHIAVFIRAQAPDSELDMWMESTIFPALNDVPALSGLIDTLIPLGFNYQRDNEMATGRWRKSRTRSRTRIKEVVMTTPNPLAKTKGAGTTFWMYTGNGDAFANPLSDTDWLRLAMVKDLQPGEMTADAEDDTYLDDEDADWKTTTRGQKSVGDTSATLAWRPGDSGQKKLVQLFDSGEVCAFRIKYPNGTVDVFRGWLSSLGKTIASKDVMTRTVKISGVGRPYLAEEGTETVGVTGLTVAPASASVKVGATTTLTFTVKPDGASDKAISVHSTDPQTATVTLNGLVATVKGVKQGSVSIVGMTSDGDFVAVATVAVSAAG